MKPLCNRQFVVGLDELGVTCRRTLQTSNKWKKFAASIGSFAIALGLGHGRI
jgi:hypothetical protein